jgi:predicted  nucleic acid-binding Zn-ribbon protein
MKRLEDEGKRQAEKRSDMNSDLEKHKNRAYTLESEVKSHHQNITGLGKQKEAVKKRINENATKLRNLVGEVKLKKTIMI